MNRIRFAIGAALFIVAATVGYVRGSADCEAAHAKADLARIEAGQKLERQRVKLQQQRDQLSRKLEEIAHAEPAAVPRCLGPSRVRRLNELRQNN